MAAEGDCFDNIAAIPSLYRSSACEDINIKVLMEDSYAFYYSWTLDAKAKANFQAFIFYKPCMLSKTHPTNVFRNQSSYKVEIHLSNIGMIKFMPDSNFLWKGRS